MPHSLLLHPLRQPLSPMHIQVHKATLHPDSFHPHLKLHLTTPPTNCTILLSLQFPDALFPDRDELPNLFGPESSSLSSLSSKASKSNGQIDRGRSVEAWKVVPGVIDIERPVSRSAERKGTEEEVELRVALDGDGSEKRVLDIPLHGRYLEPHENGYRDVQLFGDGITRLRGGIECGEWSDHTFNTLQALHPPPLSITLPTGHPSHQLFVEFGTALAIWLGWSWIMWKLWKLVKRRNARTEVGKKVE